MFDKIAEVVIGLLKGIYGLSATVVSGAINTVVQGTLIVRQPGGVAGEDEVQISDDGTNVIFTAKHTSGSLAFAFKDDAGTVLSVERGALVQHLATYTNIASGVLVLGTVQMNTAASVLTLAAGDWIQQTPGRSRVTADVANLTAVMANITGLSATLIAGRKYCGEMVLKCSETVAAEGIMVDFDGGAATMTSFAAGAGVLEGGTTVKVNAVSSALATDFSWSTITGETWIVFKITMVCNGAGTFIPRFSQAIDGGGTVTVSLGSYLFLEDMPA